jgi:hypothetical protein
MFLLTRNQELINSFPKKEYPKLIEVSDRPIEHYEPRFHQGDDRKAITKRKIEEWLHPKKVEEVKPVFKEVEKKKPERKSALKAKVEKKSSIKTTQESKR